MWTLPTAPKFVFPETVSEPCILAPVPVTNNILAFPETLIPTLLFAVTNTLLLPLAIA